MTAQLARPGKSDWEVFRRLAQGEGWRVPERELALFQGPFAAGAFILREDSEPRGFVTVVRHGRSGWVGNLIVAPAVRGRGFGSRLFRHALGTLESGGANTVWLTASEQGRPLYERSGFAVVDRVVRWVGAGQGGPQSAAGGEELLAAADRAAWGESRAKLVAALAAGGRIARCGGTVALLQAGPGPQVLGPWYSPAACPRENRAVLAALLPGAGAEVVADLLASAPVGSLLPAAGFRAAGETALMARGRDLFAPVGTVALASLGSMG